MITQETANQILKTVNDLQDALDAQNTALAELRDVLMQWLEQQREFLEEVQRV